MGVVDTFKQFNMQSIVLKSNIMTEFLGQNKTQSYLELMNGQASKQKFHWNHDKQKEEVKKKF